MKHIFVDQLTGKTIKEINSFPMTNRFPNFININKERYAYIYSNRHIDENRQEYMVVVVNKVIPYVKEELKPFDESETIDRLKTSPDGKSQIFTDSEGKVFHRTMVVQLKGSRWSSWTQYV